VIEMLSTFALTSVWLADKGNEEWVSSLVKKGDLVEKDSWRPWFNTLWPDMPAGYVTTYNVTGAPTKDFSFLTIRLAGHSTYMLV